MRHSAIVLTLINAAILGLSISAPAWSHTGIERFALDIRSVITAFPVAVFRPTEPAKVMALDVMPSAGAVEHPDNGFAWVDACDVDVKDNDNAVGCARMGVRSNAVEFGSRSFNGAAVKDVYIIRDRKIVAKFDAEGLTVYGKLKVEEPEQPPPTPPAS